MRYVLGSVLTWIALAFIDVDITDGSIKSRSTATLKSVLDILTTGSVQTRAAAAFINIHTTGRFSCGKADKITLRS